MNDYFTKSPGQNEYFSDARTSSKPVEKLVKPADLARDVRVVFDKAVDSYGSRKTSVVVRRYGIK